MHRFCTKFFKTTSEELVHVYDAYYIAALLPNMYRFADELNRKRSLVMTSPRDICANEI